MQNKKLLIAGGVLVTLVALVAFMANRRATTDAGSSEAPETATLPDLDGSAITSLTIARPDSAPITLTREGETWRITTPIEAEADENVVRAAIEKLDELEAGEVVARNAANHARLEVDDEQGLRVTVRAGDAEVADLIFGATRGGNTMVRVAGQDVVVAAEGSMRFAFDRELSAFRNKRIVDVTPERVVGLSYQVGERTLAFARTEEWALTAGEPIERFGAQRVQAVAATLARMRATDFAAAEVTEADAGLTTPEAVVTLSIGPEPVEPSDAPLTRVWPRWPTVAPQLRRLLLQAAPTIVETIVIELGGAAPGDGQIYVRVRGLPTIYTISRYTSDRLRGEASLFQEPEPGAAPEEGAEDPAGLGIPGHEGMGAPGGQQIPEELMRQIQEQMRQQGMGQ
jgi:hypothetical protein